jgi:hypothetical protein
MTGRNHTIAPVRVANRPAANAAQRSRVTSSASSAVATTRRAGAAITSTLCAVTTPPGRTSWKGMLANPSDAEKVWKSRETRAG